MEVKVNGERKTCADRMTAAGLLQSLGVDPRSVVVERNLRIIPRGDLDQETLREGDDVEIIRFVGGG